jgi:hypothetical protein
MFDEFFKSNRETILSIGHTILAILSDDTRMAELAERDLEKVARIFKLLFFSPMASVNVNDGKMVSEIIEYLREGGEYGDV